MVILNEAKRPEIEYPCNWSYKLVGRIEELIVNDVNTIMQDEKYQLEISNKSKTGKFVSFNLTLKIHTEEQRLELFNKLNSLQSIMQIL